MNPTTSHEDASSKRSSQYLDSKSDSGPGATHLEMDDIARAPELLMDKEKALGLAEDEPKKHVLTKRQDLLLFSACCFSLFREWSSPMHLLERTVLMDCARVE